MRLWNHLKEIKMFIYGASGHAKVIIEIAEVNNIVIDGVFDDNEKLDKIFDYIVSKANQFNKYDLVVAIGDNIVRKKIVNQFASSKFCTLIHPKSTVSERSIIEEGTVVMAGSTINTNVKIGKHCILNTNSSIDHDVVLADFVHVAPNAALAGNVNIGEGTSVGIGSCIIQNTKVGKWCTIGAGAVVVKDIPDYAVVVGNPGKIIKYNSHQNNG